MNINADNIITDRVAGNDDNAVFQSSDADRNIVDFAVRRPYRERDFGIGYGRSSGYGLDKRYTSDWGQQLFRCA